MFASEGQLDMSVQQLRRAKHAADLRERHPEPDLSDPDARTELCVALACSSGGSVSDNE